MRRSHVAVLAALLLVPASASADPRTELETAKTLGTEALKLYDAGDYEKALAKFDEADSHARVPTLDLFAARCLDKLHRLTAAKARYEDVTRAILPVGSSQKWIDAQEDAKKELAALGQRIPTLTIHVTSAGDRKVTLSLDGHEAPGLDVPQEVDPGKHTISVVVSEKPYTRDVELAEGDHKTEEIAVDPERSAPPPPVVPPPRGPSAILIAGVSSLSVGGAGLLLWGATGGAALGVASSQGCNGDICTGDVGALVGLRTASTVGFYIGVPLTLLGGTLLVVSATTKHGPKTEAHIGPNRVSLEMSF